MSGSEETSKKRKRDGSPYSFHTFGDPGLPDLPDGPFRIKIRSMLQYCGVDYKVKGNVQIWRITLQLEENLIPLYVIEENVERSESLCDYCLHAGWGYNFVSRRKYHILIPVDKEWNNENANLDNHLLHGRIHCNGYGHLLCINGIQGGSKRLSGKELMDIWDRICSTLQARKISLHDVSRKYRMDLRLLYGIALGQPWYGRWGYQFLRGCFGVDRHQYFDAMKSFSSLQLDEIVKFFSDEEIRTNLKRIINEYQERSETKLINLQDLLKSMLFVKPKIKKRPSEFSSKAANSNWPVKKLESTAEIIINLLKEKKAAFSSGMNRRELREAALAQVRGKALLDHVLKLLDNVKVGKFLVMRSLNDSTQMLEYSIEDVDEDGTDGASSALPVVYDDVTYVYFNAIWSYSELNGLRSGLHTILDAKYFVKEWPFEDVGSEFRFICQWLPSDDGEEDNGKLFLKVPEGEEVILPLEGTLGELRSVIQSTMRDTYCIMKDFMVAEIENMEKLEDTALLFHNSQSGIRLRFKGEGLDREAKLMYEGGVLPWRAISCKCGTNDDDGEEMIPCDICQIWHHKRCYGIGAEAPKDFVCKACEQPRG